MTARSRHDELRALADFVDASVAVWRSIDDREALPGGYGAQPLTSDTELRKTERAAWERYRAVMGGDGDVLLGLLDELAAADARAAELERERDKALAVRDGLISPVQKVLALKTELAAAEARAEKAEQALRVLLDRHVEFSCRVVRERGMSAAPESLCATHLATARAASERHVQRARHAEEVIYRLLLRIDRVDTVSEITTSEEWRAASHVIGWDIDWEAE